MRLVLLFTLSLFWAVPASADYYVTGQIQGWETRFLGAVGHFVNVDIYKSGDDYYEMKKVYSKVSDYKKKENRCWINTKKSSDIFSMALNFFSTTAFIEVQDDGSYKEVDVEFLTFPCVKR